MPKSHHVPDLSAEEEIAIHEQELWDRERLEEDKYWWQMQEDEYGWVRVPPEINNDEQDFMEIEENTYLTTEQIDTIKRNGFTCSDGLYFPCVAKDRPINNWDEMLAWMVEMKMDKASSE